MQTVDHIKYGFLLLLLVFVSCMRCRYIYIRFGSSKCLHMRYALPLAVPTNRPGNLFMIMTVSNERREESGRCHTRAVQVLHIISTHRQLLVYFLHLFLFILFCPCLLTGWWPHKHIVALIKFMTDYGSLTAWVNEWTNGMSAWVSVIHLFIIHFIRAVYACTMYVSIYRFRWWFALHFILWWAKWLL